MKLLFDGVISVILSYVFEHFHCLTVIVNSGQPLHCNKNFKMFEYYNMYLLCYYTDKKIIFLQSDAPVRVHEVFAAPAFCKFLQDLARMKICFNSLSNDVGYLPFVFYFVWHGTSRSVKFRQT